MTICLQDVSILIDIVHESKLRTSTFAERNLKLALQFNSKETLLTEAIDKEFDIYFRSEIRSRKFL